MPQKLINVGTVASDATYDSPRTMAIKINENFAEVYSGSGVTSTFSAIGASARPVQDRLREIISVEDFRKDPATGLDRSDDATLAAAIARLPATWEVGTPLTLGARVYTFTSSATQTVVSRFSLIGVPGSTVLRVDPNSATKNQIILYDPVTAAVAAGDTRPTYQITQEMMANPLPSLYFFGIRFEGNWGKPHPTTPGTFMFSEQGPSLVVIKCFENLTFEHCVFSGSRGFSVQPRIGRKAQFLNCRVEKSVRDGIACWDTEDLLVDGCTLVSTDDDAVSSQCSTDSGFAVRSRVTVVNSSFVDCNGINLGAAKVAKIAHCSFDRLHSSAFYCGISTQGVTGETQNMMIDVSHITVTDSLGRSWFVNGLTARPGGAFTMFNEHFDKKGLAAVPGYNDPATGTVVSNLPYYWANRVNLDSIPTGATKHISITHFTVDRTRPAVAKYSDWKAETAGRSDDPSGDNRFKAFAGTKGWRDDAVEDLTLDGFGFDIRGPIWDMSVGPGYIGTRQKGVVFRLNPLVTQRDMLFQRVRFTRVTFRGQGFNAIDVGSGFFETLSQQDISFKDCEFDLDPEFKHSNRLLDGNGAPTGAWGASGAPIAINLANIAGIRVEDCRFKNTYFAIVDAATINFNSYKDNILVCDPFTVNYNAANLGVAVVRPPGDTYWIEVWDCDPRSPTYDTIKNLCAKQLNSSNGSVSAQLTGKYVAGMRLRNLFANTAAQGYAGDWHRLTTGTGHVVGTDWIQSWNSFGNGDTPFPGSALLLRSSGSGVPQLLASGTTTNIDAQITPQGTGKVRFGTLVANADAAITGYILIKDEAGTLRKLAIIA